MIHLLAALPATPVPTPVPTPNPLVQQVGQLQDQVGSLTHQVSQLAQQISVTPDDVNKLLMVGGLFLLGWLGSWVQAFINSRKQLAEKVNVLLTFFYTTLAPAAVIVYQDGQLDLSTPTKVLSSVGVVLLAAWVRHNGGKLTKRADGAENGSQLNAPAAEQVVPQKAGV